MVRNWLLEEESGQGMVEYGLILVVVAIAVIASLGKVKTGLDGVFTKVEASLTTK